MLNRDPERLRRLRAAVRYLLARESLSHGDQSRLAAHFRVTRQRVHQVVKEERAHGGRAGMQPPPASQSPTHVRF